jgi:hypothetical protein
MYIQLLKINFSSFKKYLSTCDSKKLNFAIKIIFGISAVFFAIYVFKLQFKNKKIKYLNDKQKIYTKNEVNKKNTISYEKRTEYSGISKQVIISTLYNF